MPGGPLPDISMDRFDPTYWWQRVTQYNGDAILDCDFNEAQDIARYRDYLTISTAVTTHTRVLDGFKVLEAPVPLNNFAVQAGVAVVGGNIIVTRGENTYTNGVMSFLYESTNGQYFNRLGEGTVTAVDTELHRVVDEHKNWQIDLRLSQCRMVMTSGSEIGKQFVIKDTYGIGWTSNALYLDQIGSFGIGVGDTYVIIPPKLSTPNLNTLLTATYRVDQVYLQTWNEDVNEFEEPALLFPGLPYATSGRVRQRWCVRVAEGYYDSLSGEMITGAVPSSTDRQNPFAIHFLALAQVSRPNGEPSIYNSALNRVRGIELTQPQVTQEVVDARSSDWFGTFESLDARIDQNESVLSTSKLFNGSFEIGSTIGSYIPGWYPSSTVWSLSSTRPYHQRKCVVMDHSTRDTTRTERLVSKPFYLRPSQKIRLSGAVRGTVTGATAEVRLEVMGTSFKWNASPIQVKTLNFGEGSTDWAHVEDTFEVSSQAQWGRVVVVATGVNDGQLWFDDIRVEFLEDPMHNTEMYIAETEIFFGSFAEAFRCWSVDYDFAASPDTITVNYDDNDNLVLTLVPNGVFPDATVRSWPVSLSSIPELSDVLRVEVEARYQDLILTPALDGPYVSVVFYDAGMRELSSSVATQYLKDMDWGSGSQTANPAGSDFNTYTSLVSVPYGAAFFIVRLGVASNGGSAVFRTARVYQYGASSQSLANRTYHDIAINGEFGDATLDSDADADDPASVEFNISGWRVENEIEGVVTPLTGTDYQIVHWVYNDTDIQAPVGSRLVRFNVPTGTTVSKPGVWFTQIANRAITEQDILHGFVLEFYHRYLNLPADASVDVVIQFLDSVGSEIGTATYAPLRSTTASSEWALKSFGVSPPRRREVGGKYQAATKMNIGFRIVCPTTPTAAEGAWFDICAVRLWSRTIASTALQRHAPTHVPPEGYLRGEAWVGDGDEDPIPLASATQTGVLSQTDWTRFDAALQLVDLLGVVKVGINEGLRVDPDGTVHPGYAYDANYTLLEITEPTRVTVPVDPDAPFHQFHLDVVYIVSNDGTTELGVLSGPFDTVDWDMPDPDFLPDNAVVLAIGFFDQQYYYYHAYSAPGGVPTGAFLYSGTTYTSYLDFISNSGLDDAAEKWDYGDASLGIPAHRIWRTPSALADLRTEYPLPAASDSVVDGGVYLAPIEYLFNARRVSISENYRSVDTSAPSGRPWLRWPGEPTYRVNDVELAAYRIIRQRDDDLLEFFTITPGAMSADIYGDGDESQVFNEFGPDWESYSPSNPGWGEGQALTGAFEHWDEFLDSVKDEIKAIKGTVDWDDTPCISLATLCTYLASTLNSDGAGTDVQGITDANVYDTAGIQQKKLNFAEQASSFVYGYWESLAKFFVYGSGDPKSTGDYAQDFYNTIHPTVGTVTGEKNPGGYEPIGHGTHGTGPDSDVISFFSSVSGAAEVSSKIGASSDEFNYGPIPPQGNSDRPISGPFAEDSSPLAVQSIRLPPGTDSLRIGVRRAVWGTDVVLANVTSDQKVYGYFSVVLLNPRVLHTPGMWRTYKADTGGSGDADAGVVAYLCDQQTVANFINSAGDKYDCAGYNDKWFTFSGLSSLGSTKPYGWDLENDYESLLVRFDAMYTLANCELGTQLSTSRLLARVMGLREKNDMYSETAEEYEVFPGIPIPIMYTCARV